MAVFETLFVVFSILAFVLIFFYIVSSSVRNFLKKRIPTTQNKYFKWTNFLSKINLTFVYWFIAILSLAAAITFLVLWLNEKDITGWINYIQSTGTVNSKYITMNSNDIYVMGNFTDTVTFYNANQLNPPIEALTLTADVGKTVGFVAKYDTTGNLIWITKIDSDLTTVENLIVDSSNNIIISGGFSGNCNFYQFNNGQPLLKQWYITDADTSTNGYIAKYNSLGTLLWTNKVASTSATSATSLVSDKNNNIFVCGYFDDDIDLFDSAINGDPTNYRWSLTLTGTNGRNIYLAKYDTTGTLGWTSKVESTDDENASSPSLSIDGSGNLYLAGCFKESSSFYNQNSGDPTSLFTTITGPAAYVSSFIAKYLNTGSLDWVSKNTSLTGNSVVNNVMVGSQNNIYSAGYSQGNCDFYNGFDGDPKTLQLTLSGGLSQFGYFVKYSPLGVLQWGNKIVSSEGCKSTDLVVGENMSVYLIGDFKGECNFYNLNNSDDILYSLSSEQDATFISRYGSNGIGLWCNKIDSVDSCYGTSITRDSNNYIYITGTYKNNVNFYELSGTTPQDSATASLTSGGTNTQTYLVKYNPNGELYLKN